MWVMKLTKFLSVVVGLVLGLMVAKENALALMVSRVGNLVLVPTSTPTPKLNVIKVGNLQLVPTATPTLGLVKLPIKLRPVATMVPTGPAPSITGEVLPTLTPTAVAATANQTKSTPQDSRDNLTFWFLLITIGLLAVIIVVQAWPRKDEEDKE
jgi:hypothetical protein